MSFKYPWSQFGLNAILHVGDCIIQLPSSPLTFSIIAMRRSGSLVYIFGPQSNSLSFIDQVVFDLIINLFTIEYFSSSAKIK